MGAKTNKSSFKAGNPTKRRLFRFRYSVLDPNGNGTTDRIVGPESDTLIISPEVGYFDDGVVDQAYYWRFAARVATK